MPKMARFAQCKMFAALLLLMFALSAVSGHAESKEWQPAMEQQQKESTARRDVQSFADNLMDIFNQTDGQRNNTEAGNDFGGNAIDGMGNLNATADEDPAMNK